MLDDLKKEATGLMDDKRTGLRPSSNTNKTFMSLLDIIDRAYQEGQNDPNQSTPTEVRHLLEETRLAERKRCAEIARKLKKNLDKRNGTFYANQDFNKQIEAIASAIENQSL